MLQTDHKPLESIWMKPIHTASPILSERRDIACMRCPMSLLCFGIGTILANFHVCAIMLVLRAVFNMFVKNASVYKCLQL